MWGEVREEGRRGEGRGGEGGNTSAGYILIASLTESMDLNSYTECHSTTLHQNHPQTLEGMHFQLHHDHFTTDNLSSLSPLIRTQPTTSLESWKSALSYKGGKGMEINISGTTGQATAFLLHSICVFVATSVHYT